ncbi:MAG TPA: PTS sugar transporter subunit IIA [Opitutaceae bacterium]|nr:PTS sugar transporter subunit IIA [Opitutaceae bacterium]
MPLAQLPTLDSINLDLHGSDLKSVVLELFDPMRGDAAISNPDLVWRDLMARTAQGFLALDSHVALPHARTSGVRRLMFAAGRHVKGFSLSAEASAVQLVFLVLTPKEKPTEYLHMLAALSSRLRLPDLRAGLISAKTQAEFENLLDGEIR